MNLLRSSLLTSFLFCLLVATPLSVLSQQKGEEKAKKVDGKNEKADAADFSYTSKDRRDPFEPLYLLRVKKEKTSEARKTGYELEELKLVGVVKSGAVTFAMMEDMRGRGLLFKKGDFVNKNVWLTDILEDKILFGYRLKGDIRKIAIDIPRK